jgi:hypothetical protein
VSSTTGGGHPAPDELDLLLEEQPGHPAGSPELAAHVSTCASCAEVLAGMSQVRALLRAEAAHVPPPPADLEDRIRAALADAGADTGADTGADAGVQDGGRTGAAEAVPLRARPRVPRWLAAAAGLVVLGGAAATATQLVGGGADSTAMFGQDAADGGGESAAGAAEAAPDASARVVATGTDYDADTLADQVGSLLAEDPAPAPVTGPIATRLAEPQDSAAEDSELDSESESESESESVADPDVLAGCLAALGADPATPAVVDLASWQGQEAAVIVLDEEARHTVWVVERDCRPGDDGLLHYQALPD